jgi:hypothetical protein
VLDIILSRSYCISTHTQLYLGIDIHIYIIQQEAQEPLDPAEPAAGKVETPIITDSSGTAAAVVDTTEAAVVNTTEAAVVNTTVPAGNTY